MNTWLKIKQAAVYAGVSPRTIYSWTKEKNLKFSKISRNLLLIKSSDLDKFLESYSADTNSSNVNRIVNEVIEEMKI